MVIDMEMIIGMIIIGIVWLMSKATDWEFNNYTPPKGHTIDYNAQSYDRIKNHLTDEQVKRNTINGKYNVKR